MNWEETPRFIWVTVYSGVLTNRQATSSIKIESSSVLRLNLFLLFMGAAVIIAYVVMSNLLVYQRYSLDTRKTEFNQLSAKLLTEKQYGADSSFKELTFFAQKYGLIEAKDSDSILENDGFAAFQSGGK